ncbi:alpha-D-ribose 1-methylphosphonate 5-phosphate C-P lyase [Geomicrobium halophilum]|uniref:Alpha-D-ribose 1-methylphosphonate 5-phosphate C-P lyase n=1 Tax=Geomicrobium halophilum TaxID=549000 RepID=A0A841PQ16_9BACL|nr:alpha-D-ribose 1-methylphosphonate 5-phosphate C-P-lyase PhnJ [Geomicrobium halophilum]MBB6449914.1 alpha-D-ribose 1-methylphosphonate 5-phosphate C-P lyase [Geomicrobium halophilum]
MKTAQEHNQSYNYAFLDEPSKREIRRKTLKAVAIPGYQVPFASRELPIARGWGTGGLQLTLSLIGDDDCVKVIDQGSDDSVNAVSIRNLVQETTNVSVTTQTEAATIIQSRHRIPEVPLTPEQVLVLQVPKPEPLRNVESSEKRTRIQHGEKNYNAMWLELYEDIVKWDHALFDADYPVMVHGRYLMAPSPIPRWDTPKLHQSSFLTLLGAGREKKIYAVPPYTDVEPLQFDDYPFQVESFNSKACTRCGSTDVFLEENTDETNGEVHYQCSDTAYCNKVLDEKGGR